MIRATRSQVPVKSGLLVLGNQLFCPQQLKKQLGGAALAGVFMREDAELCTYFKFHQQKIVFFLAAMRSHADALRTAGFAVTYQEMALDTQAYEVHLLAWLKANEIGRLFVYEVEDHFFEKRLMQALDGAGIEVAVLPSPMFVSSREAFKSYLAKSKKPFMKTFYQQQRRQFGLLMQADGQQQRRQFGLLMQADGQPRGGKWSYDEDNRQPLPKGIELPKLTQPKPSAHTQRAMAVCAEHFADHPGDGRQLWLPVDAKGAKAWFKKFLQERLEKFGPYEDALSERDDVLFHSVLTPFLNNGLLTPKDILREVQAFGESHGTPLASLEGFVRQILGWREFMRGIYHNFDAQQQQSNHWGHHRRLSDAWYGSDTGIPPLDFVLGKVLRTGYAHHIERLMVVGSLMMLLEVHPHEAHRWFMEMFVDSSDWVMGPNVYGMALHSDGGIFATKPYICGSNYYRKMGHYPKGDWCDGVDGLYWGFVAKNRAFFAKNPRLANVARGLERMTPERRGRIDAAAEALRAKLTLAPSV